MPLHKQYDVIIIGGGAAGLMAAVTASKRGQKTLLIEHTQKIGEKIRISGGGRCNFTNLGAGPQNYLSQNPHFAKSALASYTQNDFIKFIEAHSIAYHEKTLGQLFCDGSAKQLIQMFLNLCEKHHAEVQIGCSVQNVTKVDGYFNLETTHGPLQSKNLIIATGGLSIPLMGATDFGYRIAKKFGHRIIPTRPALVPLKAPGSMFTALSGVATEAIVSYDKAQFRENILFTHRGLSGPAILQISSYMKAFEGREITINLLPTKDLHQDFVVNKNSKQTPANYLKSYLPNRLIEHLFPENMRSITEMKKDHLKAIADRIHHFKVTTSGSEGYQKAEVTVGGVDTQQLSSKTMMSTLVDNLYFIGEVVDVTGWLGGYNFQWAWSSGFAAGQSCL